MQKPVDPKKGTEMKTSLFCRWIAVAVVLTLSVAGPAHALFPPPFFFPPVVDQGIPDPPTPPDLPPDPSQPPPCDCNCPPHIASTPEPATLISGLVGLTMFGGYALRRRNRK
jgi:hypothetical protein